MSDPADTAPPTADRPPVVLFVDDEPNILSALRRMMRTSRPRWSCHFVLGGAAAVDFVTAQPIDVVVSDMRMPGMTGAEVLEAVRGLRPEACRIVLSGYAEEDFVVRAIGPAHQYLAKPCDPATLAEAVDRALALQHLLRRPDLRRLLGGLETLPSLPQSLLDLMGQLDSPTSSSGAVAAVIERDAAMLAEILKVVNSQYFAVGRRVSCARDAVQLLGIEMVRLLVQKVGIFRLFDGSSSTAHVLEELEHRSLQTSLHCRALARARGLPSQTVEEAACAGMLCEVGTLALLDRRPGVVAPLLDRWREDLPALALAVEAAMGARPGETGAYLLGLWGFHQHVIEAVRFADRDDTPPHDNPIVEILRDARAALAPPADCADCAAD